MNRKSEISVYTYGTRIHEGREVDVFTAKPKMKGSKKVCYVFESKWEKAFDELWKYWEGRLMEGAGKPEGKDV